LTNGVPDGLSEEEQRLVDDVQAFCLQFQLFTELNGQTTYEVDGKGKKFFGVTEFVSNSLMWQALRGKLPGQSEMWDSFDDELVLKREWSRMRSLIKKLGRDVERATTTEARDEAQRALDRAKAEYDEYDRTLTEALKAVETAGKKGKANAERHLAKVENEIRKNMLKPARQKHNESVHGRVYTLHDPEYTEKCRAAGTKHIPTETLDFVRHGPISDIWKHWNSCVDAFQTAKDVHGEDASSKKIYGLARAKVEVVHGLRKSGKMP
jgi:hypothetical protein